MPKTLRQSVTHDLDGGRHFTTSVGLSAAVGSSSGVRGAWAPAVGVLHHTALHSIAGGRHRVRAGRKAVKRRRQRTILDWGKGRARQWRPGKAGREVQDGLLNCVY